MKNPSITRFLAIDEEGYFIFEGLRLEDPTIGAELLKKIRRVDNDRFVTEMSGQSAWVEAFDAPLVARHVTRQGKTWRIDLPYEVSIEFQLSSLTLDEWDRFHGYTASAVPFVFSRSAQFEFFNLLDDYDDTSIEADGQRLELAPWLSPAPVADVPRFWSDIYQTETPRWELDQPAPPLLSILPQIKILKSRVLVLGCGSGNDAAHFHDQGHVVTAVDFSDEAIAQAKKKFPDKKINWVHSDIFLLPESMNGQFDLVFEHTCYCAVNPERRNELVQLWRRMLTPQGQLLAIFFVMDKLTGPPFGGSEWELRMRLQKKFKALYWTRWHHSIESRQSRELVVFANKLAP